MAPPPRAVAEQEPRRAAGRRVRDGARDLRVQSGAEEALEEGEGEGIVARRLFVRGEVCCLELAPEQRAQAVHFLQSHARQIVLEAVLAARARVDKRILQHSARASSDLPVGETSNLPVGEARARLVKRAQQSSAPLGESGERQLTDHGMRRGELIRGLPRAALRRHPADTHPFQLATAAPVFAEPREVVFALESRTQAAA
mmetsp:Transcript_7825/g.27197  ORF Transcript_7825/g.27197 Transcript_7825/m.27197 type:complete len:201 (+) Transcript_7825:405-1007(+)